jgi:hypothetical protein
MFKILAILIIIIVMSGTANAESWTSTNTTKEIAYDILTVYDVQLTKRIIAGGDEEWNPLLGNKPTNAQLNLALGISLVGHYLISRSLDKYRDIFQDASIAVEFSLDIHNRGLIAEWHY